MTSHYWEHRSFQDEPWIKLCKKNREVGEGYANTPLASVSRCSQSASEQHQRSKATLHTSTSECSDNPQLLKFDKLQRKCITDVINITMNDNQWTQATLPVKYGGLGIRNVTVLAPSSFLALAAGTLRIQNDILPVRLHIQVDSSKVRTIDA